MSTRLDCMVLRSSGCKDDAKIFLLLVKSFKSNYLIGSLGGSLLLKATVQTLQPCAVAGWHKQIGNLMLQLRFAPIRIYILVATSR